MANNYEQIITEKTIEKNICKNVCLKKCLNFFFMYKKMLKKRLKKVKKDVFLSYKKSFNFCNVKKMFEKLFLGVFEKLFLGESMFEKCLDFFEKSLKTARIICCVRASSSSALTYCEMS